MVFQAKISFRFILILIVLTIGWALVAYVVITQRVNTLEHEKHLELSKEMHNELQVLIAEKQEAILLIAYFMANNANLKEAIIQSDVSSYDLKSLSLGLRKNTVLKNIWFQIITPEGKSFYRSWTYKRGDDLTKVRLDVAKMVKEPKITSSISTGKYDLSFKVMVPVYHEGKFIGIVETLAKFNSIAIKMQKKGFDTVVLVDKSYKKQLNHAFTRNFIDDYYVANLNAEESLLDFIHSESVEHFIHEENFHIHPEENHLVTTYHLPDVDQKPMAYFVLFHSLDKIDSKEIVRNQDRLILIFSFIYLSVMAVLYYLYTKRYKRFIEKLNRELGHKIEDKTEEVQRQAKAFEHLAQHDSLTGLPNRLLLQDRLEKILQHAKRNRQKVSVLFLDLDRFKKVNDTFGHETGDKLLQLVAEKLKGCVREEDTIARLGGDEFTIILGNTDQYQVITITKKIIAQMQKAVTINGHDLYTTFSIGISSFPDDGETPEILLRNADTAMYKAKDLGKNTYQFYNTKMTELAFERMILENNLRRAIDKDEFVAYYQPKIDASKNEIIGMEALIRWEDPELGLVAPFNFIPLAEEIGLIITIDRWMMRHAMKKVLQWQESGIYTGILSLNMSIKQLENSEWIQWLQRLIDDVEFPPEYLELEITENHIMRDPESSIEILKAIKEMGITISIDDFGTGYSSLSYLKRLPIDKLKIDRSFIKDLPYDEEDASIVKSIIALAKNLNLDVVAEGVETVEQKEFLLEAGCTDMQGYLYSKPLCEEDYKEFMETYK